MAVHNAVTMGTHGSAWQRSGYAGCGNVEPLLGSLVSRPAIVCGDAEGNWDEFNEALKILEGSNPVVFGVNKSGMFLFPMHHWVTLHWKNFAIWKDVRWRYIQLPDGVDNKLHAAQLDATNETRKVHYAWEALTPTFALSGYFAMQIAYLMGAEPIVMCGCPGEPKRRFYERQQRGGFGYGGGAYNADRNIRAQVVNEMRRVPEFRAKVRS